jgi:fructosamine-3-kinase
MNDIIGNRFGYFSQRDKTASSWFDAFHIMVDDILLDGKEYGVKLPMEYDEIEQLFLSNVHAFDSVKEPRLVHWDLHDGNVIVGDDGHISGIIDCDRAIWGDPLIEFYFGDFTNSVNFLKGYGKNLLTDSDAKRRRILYNIYLYLIMVIESYYRRYDDAHKSWTLKTLENELRKL